MKPIIVVALFVMSPAWGHRIFAVFPVPARSHDRLAHGVVRALLAAGHEVTWVTPYPKQKPDKNLKIIDVSEIQQFSYDADPFQAASWPIGRIMEFGRNVSVAAAAHHRVQQALTQEYDAVLTELFLSDIHAGFAAVLQVPWIVLCVQMLYSGMETMADARGARRSYLDTNSLSLLQRTTNSLIAGVARFRFSSHKAVCEEYYEQIFKPIATARSIVLPPYSSAVHNISVLLVNGHPSFSPATSIPSNVVNIAGYHIEDNLPLPQDLQELMDNSKNGVVYFSMGSVVQVSELPEHTQGSLLRVLGALPYTVLWKFETPLAQVPDNVHVRPWLPQPAILAHPNIKLFISHGGFLSILEAIHAGVPLLAVPVYDDQPENARRATRAGYALNVPFSFNMADKLEEALHEMLTNQSYYNKAKSLSKIFKDRPTSPSQVISHYVELAIETKGAPHLYPHTCCTWFERYMLDLQILVVLAVYTIFKLLKLCIERLLRSVLKVESKRIESRNLRLRA